MRLPATGVYDVPLYTFPYEARYNTLLLSPDVTLVLVLDLPEPFRAPPKPRCFGFLRRR